MICSFLFFVISFFFLPRLLFILLLRSFCLLFLQLFSFLRILFCCWFSFRKSIKKQVCLNIHIYFSVLVFSFSSFGSSFSNSSKKAWNSFGKGQENDNFSLVIGSVKVISLECKNWPNPFIFSVP